MHIIETPELTRRFGPMEAVHGRTLAVPPGGVCALLGPNGAGKSTTIKMLMNLIEPTSGSARVLGVDSRKLGEKEKAQIGDISETQPLPLWMTVRPFLDDCRPVYPTWDRALGKNAAGSVCFAGGSETEVSLAGHDDEGGFAVVAGLLAKVAGARRAVQRARFVGAG